MKRSLLFSLVMLLVLFQLSGQNIKHVILIGIDGVSAEGFQYSQTPVMNELIRNGCISLKTRAVMPTVSAPNWATILSGAGPEQHGVTSNDWSLANQNFDPTIKDPEGYFTSIFTLIRKNKPEAVTGMIYDWDWLGTYVNKKYLSESQYVKGYELVTSRAAEFIKSRKPLFAFVYYGHPDEVGHQSGFGTEAYYQSIKDIDTEIGKLIRTLKENGMYNSSCILVVSDHGGIGKGHGGESRIELEVPWMISGPGIARNRLITAPNDLFNTAPTIARLLRMKTPQEWIGRPAPDILDLASDAGKKFRQYIAKPYCSLKEGIYNGPQQVMLSSGTADAAIFYTLDGSVPGRNSTRYSGPFTLSQNTVLQAISIRGEELSEITTNRYSFIQGIRDIRLLSDPSLRYPGKGANSLLDGLIGSPDYKGKQWMGWEGNDFEAVLDFGEKKSIRSIGLQLLQLPAAWIFLPAFIEYSVSTDGVTFESIATYNPAEVDDIRKDGNVLLTRMIDDVSTQYLKIRAVNIGTCPPGHPGEGQKAWLFISEIEIE